MLCKVVVTCCSCEHEEKDYDVLEEEEISHEGCNSCALHRLGSFCILEDCGYGCDHEEKDFDPS